VHKRIVSAVKRTEVVSDRMSYIMLRGRWCLIALNTTLSQCRFDFSTRILMRYVTNAVLDELSPSLNTLFCRIVELFSG
jgi:hypothetical protein